MRTSKMKENIIEVLKKIANKVENLQGNEMLNVPFSDGKRHLHLSYKILGTLQSKGENIIPELEKYTTLAIIDNEWRDHLREMDDLKQSVQNAVYEQKDPLLIYKMEAFKLFEQFKFKMEEEIVTFLMKCEIPSADTVDLLNVKEANKQHKLPTNRPIIPSRNEVLSPRVPITSNKILGRNDKVTVQYVDGTIKKDVKYKSVEEDVKNRRCIIIDLA
jgi:preprotein translocase subunit SecA